MPSTTFHVLLMLPSFAFVFLVLATFYGVRRAYLALSWVPVVLFVLTYTLQQLSAYQPYPTNWPDILLAVAWTGLSQCALGVVLAARAAWRRQRCVGLLLAACLATVPFLLRARV